MKRAAIIIVIFGVLGFLGGFLFVKLTSDVVPTMKEYREHGPTREVSVDWQIDKFSPGHSQHVINLALECNLCHDPARPDFKEVDFGVCTSCHMDQAAYPHLGEGGEITDCFTCHSFKFNSDADGPWDCVRCHGPFDTPTHAGLAMHADIACANCHDPHKPVAQTAEACSDCHSTFKLQHGRPELSGSCTDCHGGHKLASEASDCMSCHQDAPARVPQTAVFGRDGSGHDACVNCHEPHAFSKASAARCETCHKRQRVFAENTARDHRDCASCHDPHAVRSADDRSCKGCHSDIASTHAAQSTKDCTGCHEPHPKRVSQVALQCSQCHEEASSERAFHAGNTPCTGCHEPHRFDLSNLADRALCRRCHMSQVRQTSRNLGHSSCSACHQGTAHEPGGLLTCGSCHEEMLQRSPAGHRECASCHEPHSGMVSAQTSCTGCHKAMLLPGLHRLTDVPVGEGHTKCAACHDIHDSKVRASRSDCMTCHEDVADHQPEAKVCTGCHTFISGVR